jgi:ribosomal protein L21E
VKRKPAKKANSKIATVMGEFKRGTLHSGKGGPVVKTRDQAVAIAISEAKKKGKRTTARKKTLKSHHTGK